MHNNLLISFIKKINFTLLYFNNCYIILSYLYFFNYRFLYLYYVQSMELGGGDFVHAQHRKFIISKSVGLPDIFIV